MLQDEIAKAQRLAGGAYVAPLVMYAALLSQH